MRIVWDAVASNMGLGTANSRSIARLGTRLIVMSSADYSAAMASLRWTLLTSKPV